MAVILAESVAITKSRLAKGFNGDNFNLNGKVITTQEADKGFKAAGSVKPPFSAVMASGNQKGFAAGAANAYNDYVNDVNFNKYNSEAVFNKYFDDMDAVVEKCGIDGGRISLGIVNTYDDCVVAAKCGRCHILRFSDGELFEIAISENENGRGYQFIDSVADGDIFALIGEEVSDDLDYDSIVKVFDSGAELKQMVRDFFKILSSSGGKDCSVILIKLKSDTERTYAAIPSVSMTDDFDDDAIPVDPAEFDAQPPIDTSELHENSDVVSDDENPESGKRPFSKKKLISFIPIAILVIILAVTVALHFATQSQPTSVNEGESYSNEPIVYFDPDNTEADDDFNGSNGMQDVVDTEQGGDVLGQLDDNDNDDDNGNENTETTTKKSETTTNAPETTTKRSSVSETTTSAPETTTLASDETTTLASDETTTSSTDETTTSGAADETTTAQSEETTTAAQEPEQEPEPTPEIEPTPDEGNDVDAEN